MNQELKIDNNQATKEMLEKEEYKYGFVTDVEQDILPKGLDENVIHYISKKKKYYRCSCPLQYNVAGKLISKICIIFLN